MDVVEANIEDDDNNYTRFILLSRAPYRYLYLKLNKLFALSIGLRLCVPRKARNPEANSNGRLNAGWILSSFNSRVLGLLQIWAPKLAHSDSVAGSNLGLS